jgi:3-oxoacyl-[acyl-carrier protein] reductase
MATTATTAAAAASLDGRVALVTGAARGLGRAAAARLLARGAAVAINVRRPESAAALAAAAWGSDEERARVLILTGDVTDGETVRGMVRDTVARFGRLDILVNNAAAPYSTRFAQISEAEWRHSLDVNLTAAFLCTQAALAPMAAQGFGRVINVSSTAGRSVSTLGGAHYTASKAGMLGLTRAAAKELGRHGITVNAVCPGLIDTELTHEHATDDELAAHARRFPIQRLGTADEVADLICFLASEAAGYITGASLDINGGDLMM